MQILMTSRDYSKFIFKSFHALNALGYLICEIIMKDVILNSTGPVLSLGFGLKLTPRRHSFLTSLLAQLFLRNVDSEHGDSLT